MDLINKFANVTLSAEVADADRAMVDDLVRAAREIEGIFWKQTWSGALALRERLERERNPLLDSYLLMMGPYDRLDEHAPFIEGVPPRPAGGGFYPDDMDREEFERHLQDHPQDREAFESTLTVIRRQQGKLVAIPYREAFAAELGTAAEALRAAASKSQNQSLAHFLRARADAMLSDDYFQSDLDWMDVTDNTIDVTIGPYETYEDLLLGYKASYEAYVGVVDARESANLQVYARYLDDIDNLLASRVPYQIQRGAASPIRVINLLYNAGDARAGVQTTAFNLPNDERVHQTKGTRKVMLRNVAQAKFEHSMVPIARRILDEAALPSVTFDAYFTNVLLHEMAHGLGPTFVRKGLRELYSPIEEAKADIIGLLFHQWLIDRGVLPKEEEARAYASFLAGFFRSIRFGLGEAHGKANLVELNYLQERGGIEVRNGRFHVRQQPMRLGVEALTDELLHIEADGDYERAGRLLERYGTPSADLQEALDRLQDIPIDIRPSYPIEMAPR